jgi:alpha-ribazole phosphatase
VSEVIFVRHTEVARAWSSRCYGCTDVGLSRAGRKQARELAAKLASEPITSLVCSSLKRAHFLANSLGALKGLDVRIDDRWRERDFGTWECQTWNTIWRESGNAMDGMLTSPHGFRPGGGETTAELAARALDAFRALPRGGLTVVVAHGGPIAAVRAALAGAPLTEMARFIIPTGSFVRQAVSDWDRGDVRSIHTHGSREG